MNFLWLVTLLCSVVAALAVAATTLSSASAPQQAAAYAGACALAIIPYVFSRAAEMMTAKSATQNTDRVVAAIDHQTNKLDDIKQMVQTKNGSAMSSQNT